MKEKRTIKEFLTELLIVGCFLLSGGFVWYCQLKDYSLAEFKQDLMFWAFIGLVVLLLINWPMGYSSPIYIKVLATLLRCTYVGRKAGDWLLARFEKHVQEPAVEPLVSIPQSDPILSQEAELVPVPVSPFFTFYSVGPDMLTYSYPVDVDVLKDIYEEDGLIGPEKYKNYPGALEAIKDYDNEWFLEDDKDEVRQLLMNDLKELAKKHNRVGAYSLMASISTKWTDREKYREKGLKLGCTKCMVAHASTLYCNGKTREGFELLKKGADAGERLGCFMVAISYHYGTLCEINHNKAAEYYMKSLGDSHDFFAYMNLGCLLIEAGYHHTALKYFKKMEDAYFADPQSVKEYSNLDRYLSDYGACKGLLEFGYAERIKRVKLQEHSRGLTPVFCKDHKSPEPFVPELLMGAKVLLDPASELIEIDPKDLADRNAVSGMPAKREPDKNEDFVFWTIPVTITNPKIQGTQREVLFLEKCVHAELNSYIADHLVPLRAAFRTAGFSLSYLPSHMNDMTDRLDRIGSYHNDYGRFMLEKGMDREHPEQDIAEYWETMIPSEKLPDDCAGFLFYVPNLEDLNDHSHYEYVLFPYRPGTDWARAFQGFLEMLHTRTIVPIHDKEEPKALLPAGSVLDISPQYEFTLRDNSDQVLAAVSMPTLSKVLYMVLLNHPEGVTLKCLIDYRDELWQYYRQMAGDKAKLENIDALCDPTNNSANEKLSRIKSALTAAMKTNYQEELQSFLPTGKRGEALYVTVDRSRIKYRNAVI